MKPTKEAYEELQKAYDHFNLALFEGRLPDCLITLQREKNAFGYFSAARFVNKKRVKTDEIAMNPTYFSVRTIAETLSTLAHEMTHLFQVHFGTPGRARYHNKEWADKMEAIGLMPSSTGQEGGKRTGDRMSHYIVEGGPFENACKKLLTEDFKLSWADRFPPRQAIDQALKRQTQGDEMGDLLNLERASIDATRPFNSSATDELTGWGISIDDIPSEKVQTRAKFTCPQCQANLWGRATLNVICGECNIEFEKC